MYTILLCYVPPHRIAVSTANKRVVVVDLALTTTGRRRHLPANDWITEAVETDINEAEKI